MREKVLEFLRSGEGIPEERYNEAMALYRKSEGKSIPSVNYYNRAGYTAINLANITYDLQKLYGIGDVELLKKSEVKSKRSPAGGKKFADALVDMAKALADKLIAFDPEKADYNDARSLAAEFNLDFPDQKKETIFKALGKIKADYYKLLEDNGTDIPKNDTDVPKIETKPLGEELISAPEDAKKGLSLREKFPFLADDDCPDKLKVLVADMLTAWDNYKKAHAQLFTLTEEGKDGKEMTNAEIYEVAKEAIDNFEKNHAIWDELNYYAEHKEVLGNHPIFADDVLKEGVKKMSDADALKRRNNLRSYISKENKKLKPSTKEDAAKKIKDKVQKYTQELHLLDEKLGGE